MITKNATTDAWWAAFIRELVNMANANNLHMDGTMKPVMELVAANELVFGIWLDSAAPGGFDLLAIKGANRLRDILASGIAQDCRTTAISCVCAEQAEALRLHVGADRTH